MKPNLRTNNLLTAGCLLLVMSFASCIKDWRNGETNFSGTQPSVLIPEGGSTGNAYSAAALTFPGTDASDTAWFHANYAATTTAPADESITLAVDQQALTNFNSTSSIQYELMPDSIYSFTSTQVTVKAGDNYTAAIPLVIYPSKVDPSKSYMLPITITAAPAGAIISSNQSTIYYHIIGNPLAGNWLQSFYRWNDVPDTTGPPNSTVFEDQPVSIAPIDPTTIDMPESYVETFLGIGTPVSFTITNGVFSDFSATVDVGALTGANFTLNAGPTIIQATVAGNAANGYKGTTIETYMVVTNSAGGNRKLIDIYVKQ